MSSDNPNPISDIAEGTAKGFLEWSSEKISALVKKFKEKNLTFIQEPNTIEVVKEEYRSGESKFYETYIKDKNLLLLVRLGLALRRLEGDEDRLRNLRDKIFRKYEVSGLHVSEFVQNGILNRYIGILLEKVESIEILGDRISEILKNIDKHTIFVKSTTKKEEIIKKANVITCANSPPIFIVAGFKSAAKIVSELTELLKSELKDYDFEIFSGGEKEILFFKRKP